MRARMSASHALGSTSFRRQVVIIVSMMAARSAAQGSGEGPIAPSQGDAAQRSFGGVVAEADPAIVEEAGKVGPAPEHVIHGLQDLGGAGEGFSLAQQPGVHVVEQRLASLLAHGSPLVGAAAVDGALDLEQPIETSDRLQRDRGDRLALAAFPGVLLDIEPRHAWAKQKAGVIGIAFFCGSNNGSKPL